MSSMVAVGSIGSLTSEQFTTGAAAEPPPPLLPATPPPAPPRPIPPPSGRDAASEQPAMATAVTTSARVEDKVNARRMCRSPVFLGQSGQRPRAPVELAEALVGHAHRVEDRNQ